MNFNNNNIITYIIYAILFILIIYFITNLYKFNIFILLITLFVVLYCVYKYNKYLLYLSTNINEAFTNNTSLLVKNKTIDIYNKYLHDDKLNNIFTFLTYDDFLKYDDIITTLADLSSNKNLASIILHKDKTEIANLNKQLQNLYSINLGCNSIYIEPNNNENNTINSFKNFNQNNFSLLWNMKFDNKLFNLESIKNTLINEYSNYVNNGIFKYEIFNIRNYYSPSDNIHIPFILRCNYCMRKIENDTFTIKYLEIELDDGTILNENDNKTIYHELYDTWKNRYATYKIIAYDSVDENMEETNNSIYGFMSDNKEHMFSLIRENNTLKLYIDNFIVPISMNKLNEINTQFNINDKGHIVKLFDDSANNNPVSFFNNQTNFNNKNKNPGLFINEYKMLNNSNTYITYISVFLNILTQDNINFFNTNIKELSNKYILLSNNYLQSTLTEFSNINKKNVKLNYEVEKLKSKNSSCNFNNPKLCEICSKSTITDWYDINDIMQNAGSEECLKGIIHHCYNDPLDNSCPFNKNTLDTINKTLQYKSIDKQFKQAPTIDDVEKEKSTESTDTNKSIKNNGITNKKTKINPKKVAKNNNLEKSDNNNLENIIDTDLYELLVNNIISKKINNKS